MNNVKKFMSLKYCLLIAVCLVMCSCGVDTTVTEPLIEVRVVEHIPRIVNNPQSFWFYEVAQEEKWIYEDTNTQERMVSYNKFGEVWDIFKIKRSDLKTWIVK